jgi:predicted N-formylglutamate amidohydrolase
MPASDFSPYLLKKAGKPKGCVILADHARNFIPSEFKALGLPESELNRHIAYDIGVEQLANELAARLGATLVMALFSRLLIDPNRGLDDPSLVMELSDGAVIPGNASISPERKQARINTFYVPYDFAISKAIEYEQQGGRSPVLISIHSFTPVWRGIPRPWHAGILWDQDSRLAVPLINRLRKERGLIIGDNEPYTGALKGDVMNRHGTQKGLPHALIEVRHDLIRSADGISIWSDILERCINDCLDQDFRVPDYHPRSSQT